MAFKLESPAEAYAAISLLIVGADGVGTMEERAFLFETLGGTDVFSDHDAESFGAMLGSMTGRLVADLSNGVSSPGREAVRELCASARSVLDAEQCLALFSSAVQLANSDGLANLESVALRQVAEGLGIAAATARRMIDAGDRQRST